MFSSLCDKIYDFGTRKSNARVEKVTKITPHHMAGNLDPYNCAKWHCNGDREASANYYIGSDGTIVGGVDENRRAWTSSSGWNDQKAITIEVANNSLAPNWTISDKAYAIQVELPKGVVSANKITHITLATSPSGNAVDSNYITNWSKVYDNIYVTGEMRTFKPTTGVLAIPENPIISIDEANVY
jgi:hypothetical protein